MNTAMSCLQPCLPRHGRFYANSQPFLLSDTVGFISKLPAYMIDAFRSTLEEMIHADVTLVVLDVGDSKVN